MIKLKIKTIILWVKQNCKADSKQVHSNHIYQVIIFNRWICFYNHCTFLCWFHSDFWSFSHCEGRGGKNAQHFKRHFSSIWNSLIVAASVKQQRVPFFSGTALTFSFVRETFLWEMSATEIDKANNYKSSYLEMWTWVKQFGSSAHTDWHVSESIWHIWSVRHLSVQRRLWLLTLWHLKWKWK